MKRLLLVAASIAAFAAPVAATAQDDAGTSREELRELRRQRAAEQQQQNTQRPRRDPAPAERVAPPRMQQPQDQPPRAPGAGSAPSRDVSGQRGQRPEGRREDGRGQWSGQRSAPPPVVQQPVAPATRDRNGDGRRDWDQNRDGRRDGDGRRDWDQNRDGTRDWDRNRDGDGRRDGDWNRDGGRDGRRDGNWEGRRDGGQTARRQENAEIQSFRRDWRRDRWRNDWDRRHRSDWWHRHDGFRGYNGLRMFFYFAPGYGYYDVPRGYWQREWYPGQFLPRHFWRYQVRDTRWYGLPYAPRGTMWVYVDNDIYLIDRYDGYIVDAVYNVWRW